MGKKKSEKKRERVRAYMGPTDAAAYMGISRRSVYRLMDSHILPYCLVRLCKATVRRIPVQALDDYMTRDMSMSNEETLRKADQLMLEMEMRRMRRGW